MVRKVNKQENKTPPKKWKINDFVSGLLVATVPAIILWTIFLIGISRWNESILLVLGIVVILWLIFVFGVATLFLNLKLPGDRQAFFGILAGIAIVIVFGFLTLQYLDF